MPTVTRLEAAWPGATTAAVRDDVAGIACSVMGHAAIAGLLFSFMTIAPAPGLVEIPVEIVIEPPAATLGAGEEAEEQIHVIAPSAGPETASSEERENAVAAAAERELAAPEPPSVRNGPSSTSDVPAPVELATPPESGEPNARATAALSAPAPPPRILSAASTSPAPARASLPRRSSRPDTRPVRDEKRATRLAQTPRSQGPEKRLSRRREEQGRVATAVSSGTPGSRRLGEASNRGARLRAPGGPRPSVRAGSPRGAVANVSAYRGQVIAHLTWFKRYPATAEARGAEGNPAVAFTLDGAGRVLSVSLARSSGHSDIDAETVAMVRRAVPFPPPPPGATHVFTVSIGFRVQ